jgi:hypothetical protein
VHPTDSPIHSMDEAQPAAVTRLGPNHLRVANGLAQVVEDKCRVRLAAASDNVTDDVGM